jgi:hypothetical protein
MSLLKVKQLKFNAAGDIIVANASGIGSLLSKGTINTALFIGSLGPQYQYVSSLSDPSMGATILSAQNSSLALNGENLVISNAANEVLITAKSTNPTEDIDIRLVPQGNGQVFIGTNNTTGSVLQSDPGEVLTIESGAANGQNENGSNLILSGGQGNGTGSNGFVVAPPGYTTLLTTLAPTDAFATVGYVGEKISAINLEEWRDTVVIQTLTANYAKVLTYTAVGDIEIAINGVELNFSDYSITNGNKTVTLVDSSMGYSVDVGDIVTYRYEYNLG